MAASCAMRLSPAVAQPQLARRAGARASAKTVLPLRSVPRANVAAQASQTEPALQSVGLKVEQAVAVTTAVSTFLMAGNASAAQEIAALAADNRLGTISLLFVPVLGWVGFNILGPAFRQLDAMSSGSAPAKKGTTKRRSVAAIIGAGMLAASMLSVGSAEAATEMAQVADSDGRLGAILTLFVPAIGWVLFNILGPAQRQLQAMSADAEAPKATKTLRKRGLVAGLGMSAAAASLMAADSASAASEFAQLADSDGRLNAILTLLVPAVGWVLFNILGPAQRQLEAMSSDAPAPKKGTTKRRGVAAGLGLSAAALSLVAAESASAATEFAQVADSDGRLGAILTLFVPAVGWVLFNILGPAQRQLAAMSSDSAPAKKGTTKRRSVAAGLGLSAAAASMMLADSASAASEFAQVADSDGRLGAILTLFVPAIGWVLFNILGPAQRQLEAMSSDAPAPKKGTTKRRGVAAAVGMSAAMSLMAVESASAATEFAQVADSDGRLGAILTLFVPAVGWVLFNILGPAQRQLEAMSADTPAPNKGTVRRR